MVTAPNSALKREMVRRLGVLLKAQHHLGRADVEVVMNDVYLENGVALSHRTVDREVVYNAVTRKQQAWDIGATIVFLPRFLVPFERMNPLAMTFWLAQCFCPIRHDAMVIGLSRAHLPYSLSMQTIEEHINALCIDGWLVLNVQLIQRTQVAELITNAAYANSLHLMSLHRLIQLYVVEGGRSVETLAKWISILTAESLGENADSILAKLQRITRELGLA